VFITHKLLIVLPASCWQSHLFSQSFRQDAGSTLRQQKAPTRDEKGQQNGCASLLIFPKPMMLELDLAPDIETKVQPVAVVSSGQSLDHSS
jgi:hypothetical protein